MRSTIEAYSEKNDVVKLKSDREMEYVGGLAIHEQLANNDKHTLRVTDFKGKQNTYKLVTFE